MGRNKRDQARLSVRDGIEYKICSTCGEAFPHTEEFFFSSGKYTTSGKKILRGDCKPCKQSYQTKARKDKSAQWKKFKLQYSCLYCGFPSEEIKKESDYWVQALDFNHRDPSMKEGNLASLYINAGKEKLMEEVAKCDVLCANCHRIYTAKQREAQQIDVI